MSKLFDIYSFGNKFTGDRYPGYPGTKLETPYWLALIEATIRWNNFLSFHPAGFNAIKSRYRTEFDKEWKGFVLLGITYSYTSGIAGARTLTFSGTDIPYGFLLGINRSLLTNGFTDNQGTLNTFMQKDLVSVFVHELGHTIGLVNSIVDYTNVPPSAPYTAPNGMKGSYFKSDTTPTEHKCIVNAQFPKTYEEHHKYIGYAKVISRSPYLILSSDGKHWKENMATHDMHSWDPPTSSYKMIAKHRYWNFYNEILTPGYNPSYAKSKPPLISSKSLKYLIELQFDGNTMYVEKLSGASEVKSVTKIVNSGSTLQNPNYTFILNGTPGKIERPLTRGTRDVQFISETGTVVYPEDYVGEHNDDEVIKIASKHELMVNDPSFISKTFQCCSQEMR